MQHDSVAVHFPDRATARSPTNQGKEPGELAQLEIVETETVKAVRDPLSKLMGTDEGAAIQKREAAMTGRTLTIDGVAVPRFLYGTAWKEGETERLTALALRQGFRGIDTANQRKHYREAEVGAAVRAAPARAPSPATACSSRRSSRSATGRTTDCRTTPQPRSRRRSSSRSRVRSSTSGSTPSIPTCCTAPRGGRV